MSHLTECVVPALVEGAQVPSASELPEDLRPLTRRHAVELSEGAWGSQVGQLMDSLERARVPSPVGERAAWSVHVRNISRRERVLAMVATVKAEDAADLALPVILTTPSGDAQGLLRFGVKGLVGPLKWLTLDVDDQRVYTEGDPDISGPCRISLNEVQPASVCKDTQPERPQCSETSLSTRS